MAKSLPLEPVNQDHALLRRVFASFPSGVTAVCAMVGEQPVGMAASTFVSVSMSPPLVSVCVQDTSRTWQLLRTARRLGLSVLAAGHEQTCRSLSSKTGDRFSGVEWSSTGDGAVMIDDAAGGFVCSLVDELPAGDHSIAVLEVHDVYAEHEIPPLVFHRSGFHRIATTTR